MAAVYSPAQHSKIRPGYNELQTNLAEVMISESMPEIGITESVVPKGKQQ